MSDDPLQQQISLQNMFDAIKVKQIIYLFFFSFSIVLCFSILKTAEVYESIENMTDDEISEKIVLKEFCNVSLILNN